MHPTTVRLSDTTKAKLNDLCRLRQWSQSDWMRYWIEREWQRNRELIEQSKQLAAQVRQEDKVRIAVDRMYREEHPMWKYVDDKYGANPFTVKSVEEFKRMCTDAEFDIELTWRTDGDRDYYVDQHGDVVLEQV